MPLFVALAVGAPVFSTSELVRELRVARTHSRRRRRKVLRSRLALLVVSFLPLAYLAWNWLG